MPGRQNVRAPCPKNMFSRFSQILPFLYCPSLWSGVTNLWVTNWIKPCFAARRYTQLSGQEIWVRLHSVTTRKKLTNGLQQILPKSRCVGTSSRNRPPRQSPLQPFLVNLRNRTGEEKRRQILCDKRDNNFVWNNFSSNFPFLCTDFFVKDQKTLVLCGGER